MPDEPVDLTTRRWFVSMLGGSVLLLAGVWQGLDLLGGHSHTHGQGAAQPLDPAEFRTRLASFIETYRQPDGSIAPPIDPRKQETPVEWATPSTGRPPVEVYIGARQWRYRPATLRLVAGVPYRFNMMSFDVTHGAAINIDGASLMLRLPPETLVQDTLTFTDIGRYPLYCSYYCGDHHNEMSATLIVEDSP